MRLVSGPRCILEVTDEGFLERFGFAALPQSFWRVGGEHLAGIHQRDSIATIRLVHEVSGQEDRHTIFSGKIDQEFPELIASDGIDARCGLIENQHFGAVLDGHSQLQALANSEGNALRGAVGDILQPEPGEHFLHARTLLGSGQVEQLSVQFKVLPDRELAIERERLRHVAYPLACFDALAVHRLAEQKCLPFRCGQQSCQHFHRRGFAAAVRTEKAEDLAFLDAEAHVIDGGEGAKALGETFGFDRRRSWLRHTRRDLQSLVSLPLLLWEHSDERCFEGLGTCVRSDLGRRARRNDVAVIHGGKPVELLGFLHVGGRDEDTHLRTPLTDAIDQFPELTARQGIDTRRRLIENNEIRIVDQRAAQRKLLLHAAGELAGGPIGERIEASAAQEVIDAGLAFGGLLTEQSANEVQVLEDAEGGVKIAAEALRHVRHSRVAALAMLWIAQVTAECPHRSRLDLPHPGYQPK